MSSVYINSTRLMGYAGGDPVSQSLTNGNKVVKVSLSTKRCWMTDDGWKEATDWHNIAFFGKHADEAMKLKKGMLFSVEGRNQTSQFDDPNGGPKRYRTEVVVDSKGELQIIGYTSRNAQDRSPKPAEIQQRQPVARQPAPQAQAAGEEPLYADDWRDGVFGGDDLIPTFD